MLLRKRPSLPPPPPPATHCQCPHLTALAGPLSGFLAVPPGLYFARVFPRFKRSAAPPPPLLPSDTEKKTQGPLVRAPHLARHLHLQPTAERGSSGLLRYPPTADGGSSARNPRGRREACCPWRRRRRKRDEGEEGKNVGRVFVRPPPFVLFAIKQINK